ncbi:MAG TPA: PEGA domain-containing protein [bacterium]|nr:PEGA domain-containing protein [bacterium]HMW33555.1 PEGA domain-containing protein [bacterium]HMW36645.1 PEGA domain-containing protein [bacterium]HMY35621.1 PEGA domain-containing protein [bacterium]HMZ05491.1 PEGA domain-containing protein [bacterium]
MNRHLQSLLYLFTLGILVPAMTYCQNKTPYGYLKIISHENPAFIYLDNIAYEWENGKVFKLLVGRHTLAARRDNGLQTEQLDFLQNITINRDDTLSVYLRFEKAITIQTKTPNSASVFINDSLYGKTPYLFIPETGNKYNVRISKTGHWDTTFTIVSSDTPLMMGLRPKNHEMKSLNDNEFVNERWRKQGIHSYKKHLLIAGLSLIVTGYYTAANKKTADNAFEKAKLARRSGNIALSKKLTDKTRRYDDRARIGFIGLQISSAGFATLLLLSR